MADKVRRAGEHQAVTMASDDSDLFNVAMLIDELKVRAVARSKPRATASRTRVSRRGSRAFRERV
jgi:hypothetical protein